MKTNKILIYIFLFFLLFWEAFSQTFAEPVRIALTPVSNKVTITIKPQESVNRWQVFDFYSDYFKDKVPESYKYIDLKYLDVEKWSELYESLQILVYLNLIPNNPVNVKPSSKIDANSFFKLTEKIFSLDFVYNDDEKKLKARDANLWDFSNVTSLIKKNENKEKDDFLEIGSNSSKLKEKDVILKDVYKTIIETHYDHENIDQEEMMDSAIKWLVDWVWDKYSVYFPSTDSDNFYDSLNWEYEWIWSYVDMEKPWKLKIVTPISWSPSEKAWLKWWDLVLKVDGKEIKEENSLWEVISWIKWPAWTKVVLIIDRDWEIMELEITREKIIIKDVEYEMIDNKTFYIQIRNFWDHVDSDFMASLEELKKETSVKKIIIDLRNNWWWYLDKVSDMLDYLLEVWDKTAIVKYRDWNKTYYSESEKVIDLNKYEVIILQNSWTASASEIMIWTLKDYYPDIKLVWEKTYWKGSVQTIRNYSDGSSLKYTVAKWFTGKTETWIDTVWISPDIELELDIDKFQNGEDNQLEKALDL